MAVRTHLHGSVPAAGAVAALLALVGLGTPRPAAAQQAGYVGSEVCSGCHQTSHERFAQTTMGRRLLGEPRSELERRGCEACHGPGAPHLAAEDRRKVAGFMTFARDDVNPVERRNAVCLQCHEGAARIQWLGSAHDGGNIACTNCHSIMAPQSETGQLRFATVLQTCGQCHQRQERAVRASLSRMPLLEGAMACNNCHNPHGSPNERMLVGASVNETCYGCHAEKRGPFLWEHAPVGVQWPCPSPDHPGTPTLVADNSVRVLNRACNNCHTQVHGSNHPGGNRYIR